MVVAPCCVKAFIQEHMELGQRGWKDVNVTYALQRSDITYLPKALIQSILTVWTVTGKLMFIEIARETFLNKTCSSAPLPIILFSSIQQSLILLISDQLCQFLNILFKMTMQMSQFWIKSYTYQFNSIVSHHYPAKLNKVREAIITCHYYLLIITMSTFKKMKQYHIDKRLNCFWLKAVRAAAFIEMVL